MFVFVDESGGFETPLKMHKMRNKKQPVADAGAVAGPLDRISSYDAKQSEIEVKYADAIHYYELSVTVMLASRQRI